MRAALWLMAVALPLGAQPKLLTNAQLDTRSAVGGLESAFRPLVAAQPQPAWIGYSVAAVRAGGLGCDTVNRDAWGASGVVHLEPPDHLLVLYRVEGGAVTRVRALSPDCEIDAGGVPVHWLAEVAPAQSVALLAGFVADRATSGAGAVGAIALHADPAADAALDRFAAPGQPDWIRERAVEWLGRARGRHGIEVLKGVVASDPNENVRQRAVAALAASREPGALDLLVSTARNATSPRIRGQALSTLARKPGEPALATLREAIASDPDPQVRRRAINSLDSMADGSGVPVLIQLVRTAKDPETRKEAMNALGRSRDSRAMAFFEEVLKR